MQTQRARSALVAHAQSTRMQIDNGHLRVVPRAHERSAPPSSHGIPCTYAARSSAETHDSFGDASQDGHLVGRNEAIDNATAAHSGRTACLTFTRP
jgi:hypothetical protein